jgi:hypothetical protein
MYDLMGLYDIGESDGDDIFGDDILGDMGRMRGMGVDILGQDPAQKALVERAAMERRMRQGTVLRQYEPMRGRQLILGFASTGTVAAGATVDIIQRPQLTFRPERIVIPAAIGANFNVADVRIGKNSQFLSAGAIPGATFAEGAFGVRLKMDTAQIAMDIDLRVTNISAGALNFFAAMIGDSVE